MGRHGCDTGYGCRAGCEGCSAAQAVAGLGHGVIGGALGATA